MQRESAGGWWLCFCVKPKKTAKKSIRKDALGTGGGVLG